MFLLQSFFPHVVEVSFLNYSDLNFQSNWSAIVLLSDRDRFFHVFAAVGQDLS